MLAQTGVLLDRDGHPATEHGDPSDVAGQTADEFGGAGVANHSIQESRHRTTAHG
jgi:hypothetical protein